MEPNNHPGMIKPETGIVATLEVLFAMAFAAIVVGAAIAAFLFGIWFLFVNDGMTSEEKAAKRAITDPVSVAKYMCHDHLRDSNRDNFLIKSSKVFPDGETSGYRVVVEGTSDGVKDYRFCRIDSEVDRVLQSNRL